MTSSEGRGGGHLDAGFHDIMILPDSAGRGRGQVCHGII